MKLRKFASIDIERVIQDVDVDLLQSHLEELTFCNLREEDIKFMTDSLLVKLFRTAQLMIEYLLFTQSQLANNLKNLAGKYSQQKKALQRKRQEFSELQELVSVLENDVQTKKQGISVLETLLLDNSKAVNIEKSDAQNALEASSLKNVETKKGSDTDHTQLLTKRLDVIQFYVIDGIHGMCLEFNEHPDTLLEKIAGDVVSVFAGASSSVSTVDSIKLVYRGVALSERKTLEECCVRDGDTVVAILQAIAVDMHSKQQEELQHRELYEKHFREREEDINRLFSGQEKALKHITQDLRASFESILANKPLQEVLPYDGGAVRDELLSKVDERYNKYEAGMRQQLDAQLVQYEQFIHQATDKLRKSGGAGDLESDDDGERVDVRPTHVRHLERQIAETSAVVKEVSIALQRQNEEFKVMKDIVLARTLISARPSPGSAASHAHVSESVISKGSTPPRVSADAVLAFEDATSGDDEGDVPQAQTNVKCSDVDSQESNKITNHVHLKEIVSNQSPETDKILAFEAKRSADEDRPVVSTTPDAKEARQQSSSLHLPGEDEVVEILDYSFRSDDHASSPSQLKENNPIETDVLSSEPPPKKGSSAAPPRADVPPAKPSKPISKPNDTASAVASVANKTLDSGEWLDTVNKSALVRQSTDSMAWQGLDEGILESSTVCVDFPKEFNPDFSSILLSHESGIQVSVPESITLDDLVFELRRSVSLRAVVALSNIDLYLNGSCITADPANIKNAEEAVRLAKIGALTVTIDRPSEIQQAPTKIIAPSANAAENALSARAVAQKTQMKVAYEHGAFVRPNPAPMVDVDAENVGTVDFGAVVTVLSKCEGEGGPYYKIEGYGSGGYIPVTKNGIAILTEVGEEANAGAVHKYAAENSEDVSGFISDGAHMFLDNSNESDEKFLPKLSSADINTDLLARFENTEDNVNIASLTFDSVESIKKFATNIKVPKDSVETIGMRESQNSWQSLPDDPSMLSTDTSSIFADDHVSRNEGGGAHVPKVAVSPSPFKNVRDDASLALSDDSNPFR